MSDQQVNQPKKRNAALIAAISIVSVCVACGVFWCIASVLLDNNSASPSIQNTTSSNDNSNQSLDEPTKAPDFTETPGPTSTPKPTNTAEPTATPVLGKTRDNPVPINTAFNLDDITVTIMSVTRPADQIVAKGNMFNTKPEPNQEYLMVEMQVVCNKSSNDKCYFALTDFKAVGADGNLLDPEIFITGVDGLMESGEFFGGGTRTGKIFYLAPKGDESVVVYYDPFFSDDVFFGLK